MKKTILTNNLPPSPFTKGEIVTPPFSKGRLAGISLLADIKGISVLFLVIAMLLMVTIGYVFSYLIPTKQKGASFPIHSTKAFYLAQSGVEFAVRFAIDSGYTTPVIDVPANLNNLDGVQRNLGDRNGRFILDYDRPNNTLISIGIIPDGSERRVKVSNFTSFLQTEKGVIFDPGNPSPCWIAGFTRRRVQFYIRNARENSITIEGFAAYWAQTGTTRNITGIYMGATQRYSGSYASDSDLTPSVLFTNGNQTINSNQAIRVRIYWDGVMTTCTNIIVSFYTNTGISFTFYLDPNAVGLGSC